MTSDKSPTMSSRRSRPIDIPTPSRAKSARPAASLREGRADWYRIVTNSFGQPADVFIFDEIGYYGVSASDFVSELRDRCAGQPISLHINSPGGDVWDGMAIFNAIQQHPAPVTCYVGGLAASAASFIACAGDRLVMAKTATLMIHDALTLTIGNAADLRAEADLLDKVSDQIASIYADKTGRPLDAMRTAMRAETWFNATEATDFGLCDEVSEPQRQIPQPANTWDLSVFNYAGRDSAPAPKPPALPPAETPPASPWDLAAIRNSLKEAVK